ncbi:MAG: RNA-binding domain-containing protein [Nitritalea sp.]
MNAIELLDIISTGETSKVQFKEELPHRDSVAQEIVAMSNSLGGVILIGIKDVTGKITGLTSAQIEEYDRVVSQVADNLKPPVYIATEVVKIDQEESSKNVLIVHVQEGINKPYKTARGEIYVKQGSNKRLLTDNAEIMRLFQHSGNLLADEMEVHGTSIEDIDKKRFSNYFKKEFEKTYEEKGLTFEQALRVKRVLRNNQLTLAGLLFFGSDPQAVKPAFTIKVVSYFGNDLEGNQYRSKPKDLKGTIPELFDKGIDFLKNNLDFIQASESFNAQGKLEVSSIALEELLQNALVHRDYFKNSPIRLFIFDNRIEIISPGKLPNSLTVEDIKFGNPVIRNNQLVAFSTHTLPFSGLGSGVKRALAEQPNLELINDIVAEQFKVIIPRPKKN